MLKMILPANCLITFNTMVDIANLNLIPKEDIQAYLSSLFPKPKR